MTGLGAVCSMCSFKGNRPCRVEGERRLVGTWVRQQRMEEAEEKARDIFECCQEAGLQVAFPPKVLLLWLPASADLSAARKPTLLGITVQALASSLLLITVQASNRSVLSSPFAHPRMKAFTPKVPLQYAHRRGSHAKSVHSCKVQQRPEAQHPRFTLQRLFWQGSQFVGAGRGPRGGGGLLRLWCA